MSTQRAVVHKEKDVLEVRSDVPLPILKDDYIIVKTKAIAINPTDYKSLNMRPIPGAISGCDYSGIVEEIGHKVSTPFKVGDRVAGLVRGGDPERRTGAFAQHILAKGGLQIRIDESVSFESAATLGVGVTTVCQGLYQYLGLPLPPAKVLQPTPILIYGGSTATGTLAIQYAKLSGCEVITTASPRNFEFCKKLGADKVFDYKDPVVGSKIREATNDKLTLAFDTVSAGDSFSICAEAISSSGGQLNVLLPKGPIQGFPRADVDITHTYAYTALGEHFSDDFPAQPAHFNFAAKFWQLSEQLINSGKIRPHPVEVRPGGLDGIPQGVQDVKEGKVSGVKVVYLVE